MSRLGTVLQRSWKLVLTPNLRLTLGALIVLVLLLLPLATGQFGPGVRLITPYTVSVVLAIFLHTGLAYSWNIISGYTGYVSFGHVTFFGVGAYTLAILVSRWNWPWIAAALAGGLLAAIVSLPLGSIMLRLRGAYFAVGMLAVSRATAILAHNWKSMTRAGLGIFVTREYTLFPSYYAFGLVLAALIYLTYRLDNSPFGLRLLAIREDEDAAEAMGIHTTREKIIAFVLSAFFPGLVGALYARYITYIDPASVFKPLFNVNMILLTILGGAGTLWGPLVGGVSLSLVSEAMWARYPNAHLVLVGAIMMVVVLGLPRGILPYLQKIGAVSRQRPLIRSLLEQVEEERQGPGEPTKEGVLL